MASEDEANEVRQRYGRDLIKQGVHAIGIEEGKRHGRTGWVVVAHVAPGAKVDLPPSLSHPTKEGVVEVPLVVKRSAPFALE
jgi:hypothetical protein